MYPDEPTTMIYLVGNSTEKQGPVLWKLDWVDDQSILAWRALPSTGLVYPGDSIAVRGLRIRLYCGKRIRD